MNPTDGRAAATDADEARRIEERRGRNEGEPTSGEILDRAERQGLGSQRRVLLIEAEHPAELNLGAVPDSHRSMFEDADEVFIFAEDKAACLKHLGQDIDVLADPFSVAVTAIRLLDPTELGPDLTIWERGRTIGDHIGVPLANAEALRDTVEIVRGTDEQKALAATALAEFADFCAARGKS